MAPNRNEMIPNAHFKKHWERYVRNWFDQTGRKKRRRRKRLEKAARVAPRPAKGPLRPVVHCQTFRYNTKVRKGRGFTLEELKAAGIPRKYASTIGIAVDHRRTNRSLESLQANVQRLKEYKSKLIVFSKKSEVVATQQHKGEVLPIKQPYPKTKARAITEEERKYSVFQAMRIARSDAKLVGVREVRARQKAEEDKKI